MTNGRDNMVDGASCRVVEDGVERMDLKVD